MLKKVFSLILAAIIVVVASAGAFLIWLTISEYRPDDFENAEVEGSTASHADSGDTIKVVTWNTGYSGLGAEADFIMDGGSTNGIPDSADIVARNIGGISDKLAELAADVYLLQEVDSGSKRSYGTEQAEEYPANLASLTGQTLCSSYALNYSCGYVPYPLPPIGQVQSGIETISSLSVSRAERIALPSPFSWPLRVANLKRCLLVSYVELPESDAQLILVNFHMEAYDDGEGKAAQSAILFNFIESEYEKGNYVICGGDFNQSIPEAMEAWPVISEGNWTPGALDTAALPEGWSFLFDLNTPSCRSLDRPYDSEDESFQVYVIDGFITSPNVQAVSVETLDMGFQYSDHNPVVLEAKLS